MRVLFVDCDSEFLDIAKRFMNHCGHEVFLASCGLDCIERLNDSTPDVLVLSCELLWGGHEGVLAIMNEEPTLDTIPVILVTDEELESDAIEADARIVARVRKPYSLNHLLKQIQLCEINRSESFVNPVTACF